MWHYTNPRYSKMRYMVRCVPHKNTSFQSLYFFKPSIYPSLSFSRHRLQCYKSQKVNKSGFISFPCSSYGDVTRVNVTRTDAAWRSCTRMLVTRKNCSLSNAHSRYWYEPVWHTDTEIDFMAAAPRVTDRGAKRISASKKEGISVIVNGAWVFCRR